MKVFDPALGRVVTSNKADRKKGQVKMPACKECGRDHTNDSPRNGRKGGCR